MREAVEEFLGFAEPGAFAAAEVGGHGGSFFKNFAGPVAGFGGAAFGGEEFGKVEVGFGHGRGLRCFAKEGFCFFFLAGERVGVREESLGTMKVVRRFFGDYALEVGDGGRGFAMRTAQAPRL